MFDVLFGWRKASKCKKLIKQVQYRLKLLKNKRCAITKQLREDVIQLIKNGYDQTAFNRVEQIVKGENTMAAYELLDNFCEFILANLPYIRRHKDCPNDVNEAVSSLMYASARCGDLPELLLIRKLFGERYGHTFETTAVELCPGNLVNRRIKEKLSTNSISDNEKHKMIKEIARDRLQPELLALEYRSDWHQQQVLPKEVQSHDGITEGSKIPVSNADEILKRKDKHVDSETNNCNYLTTSCKSHGNYLECQQPPQYTLEFPKDRKEGKVDYCNEVDFPDQLESYTANCKEGKNDGRACTVTSEHEEERKTSASSCESLPQFPEEKIVYLDDVMELCSSMTREGDQRLFKFKSPAVPKRENVKDRYDQTNTERSEYWTETDNSSSKGSGKSRNGSGKGSRRRSVSKEMQRTEDIECLSYFGRPLNTSTKDHRSQSKMSPQKNILAYETEGSEETCYLEVKGNVCRYVAKRSDHGFCFDHKTENYSLEKCHIGGDGEKDNHEVSPWNQPKREISTHGIAQKNSSGEFFPTETPRFRASDKDMEWASFYQKQRRRRRRRGLSCDIRSAAYDVFTYSGYDVKIQDMEITGKTAKSDAAEKLEKVYVSSPKMNDVGMNNKTLAPYLRAVTMPPERPKDSHKASIPRTNSCPNKHPNHVHPKLPEYEDIAAKFMALKRERLQNNRSKP